MMKYIVAAGVVVLILALVFVDKAITSMDHFGQKIAPMMVTITFMQMCGTLVDFNLQWPPELKALLSDVNFININVELVSPECSVSWDYGKKLTSIMLTPVFFAALVLLNSVIHYAFYLRAERKVVAKAKGEAADDALAKFRLDFEKKHQMRSAKRHMCFSTINILMFIFQCGAIMFVRAVVGGLVCEDSGNGRTFLKAQADIE